VLRDVGTRPGRAVDVDPRLDLPAIIVPAGVNVRPRSVVGPQSVVVHITHTSLSFLIVVVLKLAL
jgi:hypothetical protein